MQEFNINKNKQRVFAFVDASNLFYGGIKSLGWKIDYQKLLKYLQWKYAVSMAFYYAGVEIYEFPYSVLDDEPIDLEKLLRFLEDKFDKKENKKGKEMTGYQLFVLEKNMARTRFYLKLQQFGYILKLKPTKIYVEENGTPKKKANCDVDMTFDMMKMMDEFNKVIVLSGDGDFAILLKYLQEIGKEIIVLARNDRTAKEIRQLTKGNFRDFQRLRHKIEFLDKKREGPAKDPSHV